MRISDWSSDVCFSDLSARLLRERYGFKGELRAVGNVLRDQLFFMLRCGFDAFEIDNPDAVAAWRDAVAEIDLFYQPAGNSGPTLGVLRRARQRDARGPPAQRPPAAGCPPPGQPGRPPAPRPPRAPPGARKGGGW